jgi:flagellar protein FlaJ
MSFIKSSLRLNAKASSKRKEGGGDKESNSLLASLFNRDWNQTLSRDPLDFDLITQLTHMSGVSTAGIARDQLFAGTAALSYSTSKFFRQVHLVAQRLNYDYSRACELVAETVKEDSVRNLLLHFSTALSAGEEEQQFLSRETAVQLELYAKEYERKVESLQKWSDAYVALMVSATLVVVISLVSMMIYPFSPISIVALAGLMVCVTFIGGWLIFTVAPLEVKTHSLKYKSPEQERAGKLAKILIPLSALLGFGVGFLFGLGPALIVAGLAIAPIGYIAMRDDWAIDARDRDIATFVRALGSVMGSVGTTITEGLSRLNRRSLGSLEPLVRRLYIRLTNHISPDLCWLRLAAESGSELVTRSVRIFWDGMRLGGDAEHVGNLTSNYALKISLLRADRKLVSTTFSFVVIPLHAVLIMILLFVTEVVQVFGGELAKVQQQSFDTSVASEAGVGDVLSFVSPALDFVPVFVGTVALMLTAANSFAPYAATGGHKLKMCLYGAIMMVITGLSLIGVPYVVDGLFANVAGPSTITEGIPTDDVTGTGTGSITDESGLESELPIPLVPTPTSIP